MSHAIRRCLPSLLALAALHAPAAAGVTVLGKPELGTFTTIQGAIDAADAGDVLLVGAGTYNGGFTIDAKSLTLLGQGLVQVNGKCTVQNLAANGRVGLVELRITGPTAYGAGPELAALALFDDLGHVRVQDCTLVGGKPDFNYWAPTSAGPGLSVIGSPRVMVARSTLTGGHPGYWSGYPAVDGGEGLHSVDSALALHDCTIKGGVGSHETYPTGGVGGAGARIQGWGVFSSGTAFTGGGGGGGDYIGCTYSGDGGDGVVVSGAQLQLLDSPLTAGVKGNFGICGLGENGEPLTATNAAVTTIPGVRRRLDCADTVADGSRLALTFHGAPGDRVWLASGPKPAFQLVPFIGIASVPWPWLLTFQPLGTLDASGTLTAYKPFASYSGALAGWNVYLQPVCVDTAGETFLGTPVQVLFQKL